MTDQSAALAPTRFVDSDHPDVIAFAEEACGGATGDRDKAARLFRAVRDRLRYDPYSISVDPDDYRASRIVHREAGWCVPKAVLLCAAARAAGIPARLGFSDVRNHLATEKLRRLMGTDLFAWHGWVELSIAGRTVKASPAFNAALCARFGVPPLELDGEHDALLQAFDGEGRRYMEYVRERGVYLDLPLDEMFRTFAEVYGRSTPPSGEHDEAFHSD